MGEIIDLLIKGGKVYDGTGNEPFIADIGIVKDRIAFVGGSASEYGGGAVNVIRADGLSVSPGFIDTHGPTLNSRSLPMVVPRAKSFRA